MGESRRSDTPSAPTTPKAFTVADVVSRIRALVEGAFPTALWVEGELSNCSYPASGHIYFDLVDERVTDRRGQRLLLPCAFFRNANQTLKFRLEDGMKVLCLGELTTYEAKGQYQLRVLRVEPKGVGALQVAFEQLKRRLAAEGLFDEARKRPIPTLPDRIGIVTSTTGSAIHDLLVRLRGRFHLVVLPVKVQGDGAADEIAAAIRLANTRQLADVLIVGRGGGSLEDLWAFNEEPVARAIVASRIPVISAVGHEDHWTIADYVADLRASTPTHAAQLLTHTQQLVIDQTRQLAQRLVEAMAGFLEEELQRVSAISAQLRLLHPLNQLTQYVNRVHELQLSLTRQMRHVVDRAEQRLATLAGRLEALSPLAVLARGYSITFHLPAPSAARQAGLPSRHVLTDSTAVQPGDALETRLARGRVISTVTQVPPDRIERADGSDA